MVIHPSYSIIKISWYFGSSNQSEPTKFRPQFRTVAPDLTGAGSSPEPPNLAGFNGSTMMELYSKSSPRDLVGLNMGTIL